MKNFMKILGVLCALTFCFAGCKETPEEEPVGIRLNKEMISSLPVGGEQTLVATITPEGTKVTVVWSSDNEAVAVVNDEGLVTGVAPGTATITAKAEQAVATCKVTVVAVKPTAIELDPKTLELNVGSEYALEVKITPENAVADDIAWTSTDDKVATVKNGMVKAIAKGNATITVKCNGGTLAAVCQVTVNETEDPAPENVPVTEIKMTSALSLEVGNVAALAVTVLPENATNKAVDFVAENDCVEVDPSGNLKAVKAGTCKVTATAADGSGVKAECTVTVTDPIPEEEKLLSVSIVAKNGETDIQIGVPVQLELVCNPSTAKPKSVSWTTDNDKYATVDQNGLVTAWYAEKGTDDWINTIVSVNADGFTANLKLRVIPRQADAIVFDVPDRALKVGEPWTVNARITPENAGLPYTIFNTGGLLNRDGVFMSGEPGHFDVYYAISEHDDLVYERRATFSVDVDPYWVETVSLDQTLELETGSSTTLIPAFTSDVAGVAPTFQQVEWKSSDENVVKVDDNGNVTAVGAGSATVTVTTASEWSVPAGSAQKTASCSVIVTEATNPVYVGDYFYSDGTWSTELQSGKTVVGIVFATANATSTDPQLKKDYPGATHGLVVSIKEYDSPVEMVSGAEYSWNAVNNYAVEQGGYASMAATDIICGYSNTQAMKAFKAAKGDYSKYLDVIDGHNVPVTGASTWYMPCQYELSLIGASYDVINSSLEKVGDKFEEYKNSWDGALRSGIYWSSTYLDMMGSQSKPYILSTNQLDATMKMHSYSYQVRLVFAF